MHIETVIAGVRIVGEFVKTETQKLADAVAARKAALLAAGE